jgi:hypothetical protein
MRDYKLSMAACKAKQTCVEALRMSLLQHWQIRGLHAPTILTLFKQPLHTSLPKTHTLSLSQTDTTLSASSETASSSMAPSCSIKTLPSSCSLERGLERGIGIGIGEDPCS